MKKSSSDLTTGSVAKQLLMFGHTAHSSGTDASRQRWRRYDTYHDASLLYAVSQSDFCQYRPRLWKIQGSHALFHLRHDCVPPDFSCHFHAHRLECAEYLLRISCWLDMRSTFCVPVLLLYDSPQIQEAGEVKDRISMFLIFFLAVMRYKNCGKRHDDSFSFLK